mgnify:CR=1 FL=1
MTLPKLLKIGNRSIKVEIGSMDANLMGTYNPRDLVISLNQDLTKVQTIETFWHELIHAINDYNRVTVEIEAEIAREDTDPTESAFNLEERMTENFAKVFLQVVQDNNLLAIKN